MTSTPAERAEAAGIINSGLEGRELSNLSFSHAVEMGFADVGSYASIRLESPFRLVLAPDFEFDVVPEDPSTLAPVLGLLRVHIRNVSLAEDSTLTVRFLEGQTVLIGPSRDFEAWEYVSHDHGRVVVMPGGGLAYWSPDPG